jgi:exopolyphosphatase/guanosine-5'-triphosphate,3'-diphosphate pyrophosphatase
MLSKFYVSIDLGSNSFRLLIAKIIFTKYGCQVLPILNDRQPVALASGLDANNNLNDESIQRAIKAFNCFKNIIDIYIPSKDNKNNQTNIFIVATSTFRIAKNIDILISAGQEIFGTEIKTISGIEEAKLIYQGTSHTAPYTSHNRLVVDIGGGSTEFIIGKYHNQLLCESVDIGCINITQTFFCEGYSTNSFNYAIQYVKDKLNYIIDDYIDLGWVQSVGSSGTSRALAYIASQIDDNEHEYILTLNGLNLIKDYLVICKTIDNIKIKKINYQRASILAGGLSIMLAIFNSFNIQSMYVCEGGVRFGLLYESVDSIQDNDIRNISIDVLRQRFSENDIDNSSEIDEVLNNISNRFINTINIQINILAQEQIQLLKWALILHNIGKYISLDSMHKHSAYIVQNTYLAGFELNKQNNLVNMLLGQKGGLSKINAIFIKNNSFILLILRLCLIIFKNGLYKNIDIIHKFSLNYIENKYILTCPLEFQNIFEDEQKAWAKVGIILSIK